MLLLRMMMVMMSMVELQGGSLIRPTRFANRIANQLMANSRTGNGFVNDVTHPSISRLTTPLDLRRIRHYQSVASWSFYLSPGSLCLAMISVLGQIEWAFYFTYPTHTEYGD